MKIGIMMIAVVKMTMENRIAVNYSKKKNLNWDLDSYTLFYTKRKYCYILDNYSRSEKLEYVK